MSTPKQYVPKSTAKEIQYRDGGSKICLGFNATALIEFIRANTTPSGWFNVCVAKRREPSEKGNTHYVYLDTYQPKQSASDWARSDPSAPVELRQSTPTTNEEVPF